jgi:hypothetical protein
LLRHFIVAGLKLNTQKNATNGHLGNDKATVTRIAAINVGVMMTATVTSELEEDGKPL